MQSSFHFNSFSSTPFLQSHTFCACERLQPVFLLSLGEMGKNQQNSNQTKTLKLTKDFILFKKKKKKNNNKKVDL